MTEENLIIIGSGPAGLTAGIYAARANLKPLLFAGNRAGGMLTQTTDVENFPGFPQGIPGPDLMMNMQSQAERFGCRIEYESVMSVELSDGLKQKITLGDGRKFECGALIVATGADVRKLGIPDEEKFNNHGVSYCATCDGAFYPDVPVAVIGGGDSAAEEALFLTHFASRVYLVHRRHELRASKIMVDRIMANPKIEMVWDSVVDHMDGDSELESITVRGVADGNLRHIACKGCFIALGHIPDTKIFAGQLPLDEKLYIVRPGCGTATGVRGVFAAGDCTDQHYRQAITAAGTGCQAAMDAEKYLADK